MKIKTGSGQLLLNVLGKSDVCTWPTRHYQHLVITKLRTLHYSSWLTGSTYFAPPISLWWKTSWHDKWRPVMSWANPNVQNFDNFHLLFFILLIYRLLINFHFLFSYPPNLQVASNKVSTKVKAISFAENGSYFVTAGNRQVTLCYLFLSLCFF